MTVRASVLLVAAFALAILVQTPLAVSQTNLGSVTRGSQDGGPAPPASVALAGANWYGANNSSYTGQTINTNYRPNMWLCTCYWLRHVLLVIWIHRLPRIAAIVSAIPVCSG